MVINGVGSTLVATQKPLDALKIKPKPSEPQSFAVEQPAVTVARHTNTHVTYQQVSQEQSQNKALQAYHQVASSEKKEQLTALLGIDLYA